MTKIGRLLESVNYQPWIVPESLVPLRPHCDAYFDPNIGIECSPVSYYASHEEKPPRATAAHAFSNQYLKVGSNKADCYISDFDDVLRAALQRQEDSQLTWTLNLRRSN